MPVRLDARRSSRDRKRSTTGHGPVSAQRPGQRSQSITIGLVNNMPEAAFHATERQFISLLDSASEGIPIYLSLYVLPGAASPAVSASREGNGYSSVETLWEAHLDGLIVTGRESQKPNLKDEPYWDSFTTLVDWAQGNTYSAVWSCLAAHAAVLHLDDIGRRRSGHKHSGIFDCFGDSSHYLTAGVSRHIRVPHSRWHGIAEDELTAHGYRALVRTADAEPDTFVRQDNSLFVFFQGHAEYESDTLLREYRRDVGRYLRHEVNTYPPIPRGYFDQLTEEALSALREKASSLHGKEILAEVSTALEQKTIENTWHSPAARIYRNWLEYIRACKETGQAGSRTNSAPPRVRR